MISRCTVKEGVKVTEEVAGVTAPLSRLSPPIRVDAIDQRRARVLPGQCYLPLADLRAVQHQLRPTIAMIVVHLKRHQRTIPSDLV
jgi:hypothetical protein